MGFGSEEIARWEKADGGGKERILVSVRVRPLNAKEIEKNDPSDWACINSTTIIYKPALPERSLYPSAYTFDRVFGCECNTRRVYHEGAKEVALSVVNGINASIFAYGQTSSGKTFTMTGITEYAVEDVYDYIKKHEQREFVLKFSAMEIYNEAVRDLLSTDNTPLRLLDDPERGTVVDKLTEETLRDQWHLKELLSICAAQRQVGETSLNEMSSRSHQILRLTIESSARKFMGKDSPSTLYAAVNFVDLAGSERASQVSSAGNRLKEGCHINRSLLTLGTVIRKLSKGRTGHIPYRDSKLTRILQPFLGGNARTAIICTMSPARSHHEQSRNTLLFASCAKQVVTNAQVNVVMSDKALVKHLQRELARLENELRYPGSVTCTDQSDVLKDKDSQIKKMEREIRELMQQRDLAQSRLEDLLQAVVDDQISRHWEQSSQSSVSHVHSECEDALSVSGVSGIAYQVPDFNSSWFETSEESNSYDYQLEITNETKTPRRSNSSLTLNEPILQEEREEIVEATCNDSDDHCKEVQCVKIHASSAGSDDFNLLLNDGSDSLLPVTDKDSIGDPAPQSVGSTHMRSAMEQTADTATRITDDCVIPCSDGATQMPSVAKLMNSRELVVTRNTSCKASLMDSSVSSWLENAEQDKKTPPEILKEFPGRPERVQRSLSEHYDVEKETPSVEGSQHSERGCDMTVTEDIKTAPEEADTAVSNSVSQQASEMLTSGDMTETKDIKTVIEVVDTTVSISGSQASDKLISSDMTQTEDIKTVPGEVDTNISDSGSQASEKLTSSEMTITENIKTVPGEVDTNVSNSFSEMNEMAESNYQKQFPSDQTQLEAHGAEKNATDVDAELVACSPESPSEWQMEFERKQQEIIELWHACNVPLVHRTCFFLLFKGDPSDAFYMEVEFRRLSFLRNTLSQGILDDLMVEDGHKFSRAASLKHLRQERNMLCKQTLKKLKPQEREGIFAKWGIALNSKQRRLQLAQRIWSKTDLDHVKESATLVAKLIGFVEQGQAMKEMFGLSFTPQQTKKSFTWMLG